MEIPKGESSALCSVLDYESNMLYFMHIVWLFFKKSDLLWETYLSFFLTHSGQQKEHKSGWMGAEGKLLLEEDLRL